MNDILAALGIIGLCALVIGFLSGDWIAWVKSEWRLIRSYHWTVDEPEQPLTLTDPRCQRVIFQLADARKRMRRERIPYLLTDGKPEWRTGRKVRAANVTPIRRAK